MLERIADVVGRKKVIIPMPIGLMTVAAYFLDWMPQFPVTRDQLRMLAEGNAAQCDELTKIIDREPRRFDADSLSYLRP